MDKKILQETFKFVGKIIITGILSVSRSSMY